MRKTQSKDLRLPLHLHLLLAPFTHHDVGGLKRIALSLAIFRGTMAIDREWIDCPPPSSNPV
jgi:hypothetical protein